MPAHERVNSLSDQSLSQGTPLSVQAFLLDSSAGGINGDGNLANAD